jgi:hypothetical protein
LSLSPEKHRLALPVDLHDTFSGGINPNWHSWTNSGLQLIEIDTGELPSLTSVGGLITSTNEQQEFPDYDWNVRSVIHGDSVYYLSVGKVWSANWNTPDIIDGPK